MKTRIIAMLAAVLLGFGLIGALVPQRADASAFEVQNQEHSYTGINIHNKAGCVGSSERLSPGENATPSHLWKTFGLPAHSHAHIHFNGSPYSYNISNPHSYVECRAIGQYFAPSWTITVYRN